MSAPPLITPPVESPLRGRLALLGALVGAWLIPVVLHAVHADVLLWLVLVVAVAGLLRAGSGLLDQLVLAGGLVVGGTLAAGLIFSLWSWHLSPVPVGGTLLTAAILIGAATRRRFALPRSVRWSDLIVVGTAAVAAVAAYRPLVGKSSIERLTNSVTSLDRAAQFALYRTVERTGGYAFLHQSVARHSVERPTEVVYPQGAHFLFALADSFFRSGRKMPASVLYAYDHYFVLVVGVFALGCGLLVWAARWAAGPHASEGRRALICAVVAAFVLCGPTVDLVRLGNDGESVAVLFLVVLAALVVRPVASSRDHVVLVGALVIAIFYCYNLFGFIALLALAVSALFRDHALRRELWFSVAVLVPAAAIALVPTAMTVGAHFDVSQQSVAVGYSVPISIGLVCLLLALVALPFLRRSSRPDSIARNVFALLISAGVSTAAIGVYQQAQQGHVSYYFHKFVLATYLCLLVSMGAALAAIGPLVSAHRVQPRQVAMLAVSCIVVTVIAVGQQEITRATTPFATNDHRLPLVAWARGRITARLGPPLVSLAKGGFLKPGPPTVVAILGPPGNNWSVSFFIAALQGRLGDMTASLAAIELPPVPGRSVLYDYLNRLLVAAQDSPGPLRIIVTSRASARSVRAMLAGHPEAKGYVVVRPSVAG